MATYLKILLLAALCATAIAFSLPAQSTGERMVFVEEAKASSCTKIVEATSSTLAEWDCTEDVATVKKWAAYEKAQLEARLKQQQTIKGVITHYGRADSCHNPKIVNGKTLCLTAAGRDTQEGVTVACPRNIKLGTKVEIYGHIYTCEDRYASYLDAQRGLPTFDIFFEAGTPKPPGKRIADVRILDL